MQSPIQELLEVLKKAEKMNEHNKPISIVFSSIITLVHELNLPQKETIGYNKAFNDGRLYKPHIQKKIINYFKEEYDGKEK